MEDLVNIKTYNDLLRIENNIKNLVLSFVNSISKKEIKDLLKKLENRVYKLNTSKNFKEAYFNMVIEFLLSILIAEKIREAGSFEKFLKTDKLSTGENFLDKLTFMLVRSWLDVEFPNIKKLEEFILNILEYTKWLYKKHDGFAPEEELKEYIMERIFSSKYIKSKLPIITYVLKKLYRYYPPEKINYLIDELKSKNLELQKVISGCLLKIEAILFELQKQKSSQDYIEKLEELKKTVHNYLVKIRKIDINDPISYINEYIIITNFAKDVLKYCEYVKKIIDDPNISNDVKKHLIDLLYYVSKFLEDIISAYLKEKLNETIEPSENIIRKVLEEKLAENLSKALKQKLKDFGVETPYQFVTSFNKIYWFFKNYYSPTRYRFGYKRALELLGIDEELIKPALPNSKKIKLQKL